MLYIVLHYFITSTIYLRHNTSIYNILLMTTNYYLSSIKRFIKFNKKLMILILKLSKMVYTACTKLTYYTPYNICNPATNKRLMLTGFLRDSLITRALNKICPNIFLPKVQVILTIELIQLQLSIQKHPDHNTFIAILDRITNNGSNMVNMMLPNLLLLRRGVAALLAFDGVAAFLAFDGVADLLAFDGVADLLDFEDMGGSASLGEATPSRLVLLVTIMLLLTAGLVSGSLE
ncbi:hypothetical protein AGLY_016011 [Aphis glycines]|uniref:Uncharacterized protein n=1 Tax=Aphis glycines TaxID=307491 RepID=A0A6G0SYQ3_APHGL|nr:hypothetical protein AGLY_016011 [Aphis glycines]